MGLILDVATMEHKNEHRHEYYTAEHYEKLIKEDQPEGSRHKFWVLMTPKTFLDFCKFRGVIE